MTSLLKAAVLGFPVAHSLSPKLHTYWLKRYGIPGSYEAIAVAPPDFESTLRSLAKNNFVGVNLTVPHKEAALKFADMIDDQAKHVGAVNTIVVRKGGLLEGRNTDVFGFKQNLIHGGYTYDGRDAVVLGAGGAARAAIVALQDMGVANIRVINRTILKAENLAQEFSVMEQSHFLPGNESVEDAIRHIRRVGAFGWGDAKALENAGLLVNATSLGMRGEAPLEVGLDSLPKDAFVTDMIYAPLETDLLRRAKARGNKIVDGLGMLLYQARPAFQAFFGHDPEVTPELRAYILGA